MKCGKKTVFEVKGRPFIAIAGETHNSSASSPKYMEAVWDKAVEIGLNTVLLPVSWELIEPEEGRFEFALVDKLLEQARKAKLHIIFLWFGSWKNAQCSYAPEWVKKDVKRFWRAEVRKGRKKVILENFYHMPYTSLSYLCEETKWADARAFAALMRHIREVDGREGTVIGLQIENESGIQGAKREHSDLADEMFHSEVPGEFARHMGAAAGGMSWQDAFAEKAEEIFSAFHIASYIECVARAGRAEYDLPLMVNCWLEQGEAGDYPSGGPIAKMMDVWRYAAPSIDVFAPDIYVRNFTEVCEEYRRDGNPLVIPETAVHSHCAPRLIYCVGHHHASCFSPFGFEDMGKPFGNAQAMLFGVDVTDPLLSRSQNPEEYRWCTDTLNSMMGLLIEKYGTKELKAVISENMKKPEKMEFKEFGFEIDVCCEGVTREDGVCLILSEAADTFYIILNGCKIRPYSLMEGKQDCDLIYLEEGAFADGEWSRLRRLNGDEAFSLIFNQFTLLKMKLFAY